MALPKYKQTSVYSNTKINKSGYLDFFKPNSVPIARNDVRYEITTAYTYRPDLLAHDLYGTKDLWWVFAQRNPEVLKDPIFDFVAGTTIFLPQRSLMQDTMGL